MKISVLTSNKRGATTLLDQHFGLLKHLISRYPNALWRKVTKKDKVGYELEI
jgi:hypothetical protein